MLNANSSLSAIIPNYNHAVYLRDIIAQHITQTRPADEIIVVDDGSTDDSRAVLDDLKRQHPSLTVVTFEENRGVNAAAMAGLAMARGDYVRFGSTNDPIEPDFFEVALDLLEAHPEAALFFADPAMVEEDGGASRHLGLFLADQPTYLAPDTLIARMSVKAFNIPSQTLVLRRAALEAIGGFRPELAWHADWFAKMALSLRHGACYAPRHVARSRVHADAYSARNVGRAAGEKALLYRILDLLAEPAFKDVATRFADAGILPELRLRDLFWLAARRQSHHHLSARLITRCVMEEVWTHLRPLTPMGLRQRARTWSSRLTR